MKNYWVYILTNKASRVLYTGVTSNLEKRINEHKSKLISGFTKKYNLTKLVFFEEFSDAEQAIATEKKIKGWLRQKKINLIEMDNPSWKDLAEEFQDSSPSAQNDGEKNL